MVTLEQVKQLEEKVVKAIDYVTRVTEENKLLQGKLDSSQKRISELEGFAQRFKDDQSRIEEGIISALDRLNQFEDAIGKSLSSVHAVVSSGLFQEALRGTPSRPAISPAPSAKPPETPAKSPEVPVKPLESSVKPPETPLGASVTSAKPPETPVKSPEVPAKPPESSVKPPETLLGVSVTSAKPPETPVKSPEVPVKPPESSVKPSETLWGTSVTSAKPPVTPVKSPETLREVPSAPSFAVPAVSIPSIFTIDDDNDPRNDSEESGELDIF